uniref:Uncharacterized protein n=1 Tax=Anopheles atroparvus TaxID=41427 RepID=A0A182J527_ANOAO
MSTTDFEAFREYHWLDTPDAVGPVGQRHGIARTSTPIRDTTMAAAVALASLEDLDTLSPLSTDMGEGRKLALPDEKGATIGEGWKLDQNDHDDDFNQHCDESTQDDYL